MYCVIRRLQDDYKHLAQSSAALRVQYESSCVQAEALMAERDSLLRKAADREEEVGAAQRKVKELELENSRYNC